MCAGVLHESRIEKEVPSPLQGTPETEGRMGGGVQPGLYPRVSCGPGSSGEGEASKASVISNRNRTPGTPHFQLILCLGILV